MKLNTQYNAFFKKYHSKENDIDFISEIEKLK